MCFAVTVYQRGCVSKNKTVLHAISKNSKFVWLFEKEKSTCMFWITPHVYCNPFSINKFIILHDLCLQTFYDVYLEQYVWFLIRGYIKFKLNVIICLFKGKEWWWLKWFWKRSLNFFRNNWRWFLPFWDIY